MSDYYEGIQKRLIDIIDLYPEKNRKKLQLDLLQRIIERMEETYKECDTCQFYQDLIEEIVTKIENSDKTYKKDIRTIKSHLLKQHHLLEEGFYMAIFMSIGVSFGVAFGTIYDNLPVFMGFGISFGISIGAIIDAIAKKNNKVL